MKTMTFKWLTNSGQTGPFRWGMLLFSSVVLAACGGGGGGGAAPEPEAVVRTVAAGQVFEGNAGTQMLEFLVTLDKPVVRGLDVTYSTASTAVTVNDTAAAKGGAACGVADVDFVTASGSRLSMAPGASTGLLTVMVCGDAKLEPTKTLKLSWTSTGAAGGTVTGTIINDDVGGSNGAGVAAVMGGGPAFGRDANPLTNSNADGALGFSFSKRQSATEVAGTWNCTQDNVTGLTWQRLSAVTSAFDGLGAYVTTVNAAQPCGYADWRVPNANELLSLMDASRTALAGAPNADRDGLSDAMSGKYWSSNDSVLIGANNAWLVDAGNGGAISYDAKTSVYGVRLVRGTSSATACNATPSRHQDFGDGTVADAMTGLMWKKCPEGSSGATCAAGGTPFDAVATVLAQLAATNAVGSPSGLTYTDWRIPSRNELASLVNRSCVGSPVIDDQTFPNNKSVSYVTSTVDANNANQYWAVDFTSGTVNVSPASTPKLLRLVRAGQ